MHVLRGRHTNIREEFVNEDRAEAEKRLPAVVFKRCDQRRGQKVSDTVRAARHRTSVLPSALSL